MVPQQSNNNAAEGMQPHKNLDFQLNFKKMPTSSVLQLGCCFFPEFGYRLLIPWSGQWWDSGTGIQKGHFSRWLKVIVSNTTEILQ